MISHAPKNYICPFCAFVKNTEAEGVLQVQQDIIYQDHFITAFISPKWWEKNPGNVIIIPNEHFENIYDLPNELGYKIHDAAKEVAIALKTVYKCDGVSTRQHNEPAGNQDVFHYHLHVFPRYTNDNLYKNHDKKRFVSPEERLPFAEKLRNYFKNKHE